MTFTDDMVERDTPLDACPNPACRRSGPCRNEAAGHACLRTHETMDEFRRRLARKIGLIMRDHAGRVPPAAGPEEVEERLAELKRALEAREAEAI